MNTLDKVKPGNKVSIVKIHGVGRVKKKLNDMGLTKNVEVLVKKVAPLGDPIEITIRGYELSLRKDEASNIEVA